MPTLARGCHHTINVIVGRSHLWRRLGGVLRLLWRDPNILKQARAQDARDVPFGLDEVVRRTRLHCDVPRDNPGPGAGLHLKGVMQRGTMRIIFSLAQP